MSRFRVLLIVLFIAVFLTTAYHLWPFAKLMGFRASTLLAAFALAYFVAALFPIWFPAWRAFRRCARIPRAWLFVATVAGLSYGSFSAVLFCVSIPLEFYLIFVAPQLQEMGKPFGQPLDVALSFIASYGWIALPLILVALSVWLTRYLLPRWPAVVVALRG
jgi:hypothetical protein